MSSLHKARMSSPKKEMMLLMMALMIKALWISEWALHSSSLNKGQHTPWLKPEQRPTPPLVSSSLNKGHSKPQLSS